jgi:hypothetical protein
MVRAILDGRKTQTRRVVKPQPKHIEWFEHQGGWCAKVRESPGTPDEPAYEMVRCPYGVPGDRLWVRETWYGPGLYGLRFRADNEHNKPPHARWKPSIHMPRWASRITLEVTGVRVERVREIRPTDVIWEGVEPEEIPGYIGFDGGQPPELDEAGTIAKFRDLWDSINAKRGFGWDENPWVWVVEFKSTSDA